MFDETTLPGSAAASKTAPSIWRKTPSSNETNVAQECKRIDFRKKRAAMPPLQLFK